MLSCSRDVLMFSCSHVLMFSCSRLPICNRSISTVGSGLGPEPGSPRLTRQLPGGRRTPGPTPATSPSSSPTRWLSPTMLNISSRGPGSRWRPVWPSSTPGTTTVSSGTTAPATGPRCGYVRWRLISANLETWGIMGTLFFLSIEGSYILLVVQMD